MEHHLATTLGCSVGLIRDRQAHGILPAIITPDLVAQLRAQYQAWLSAATIAQAATATGKSESTVLRLVRLRVITPIAHPLGGRERVPYAQFAAIWTWQGQATRKAQPPLQRLLPDTTPVGWLRMADVAHHLGCTESVAVRACKQADVTMQWEARRWLAEQTSVEQAAARGAFARIGYARAERQAQERAERHQAEANRATVQPTYAEVAREYGYTRQHITSLVRRGIISWPLDATSRALLRERSQLRHAS